MANFVAGAFWGLVVSGAAATVASLSAPQPAGNTPPVPPMVASPQATDAVDSADTAEVATPVTAPDVTDTPTLSTPSLETAEQAPLPQAGQVDSTPLAQPDAAVLTDPMAEPDMAQSAPVDEPAPEDPVFPNPQSLAPEVPVGEADIVVETETPGPVIVADPTGAGSVVPEAEAEGVVEDSAQENTVYAAEPDADTAEADMPDADVPDADVPDVAEENGDDVATAEIGDVTTEAPAPTIEPEAEVAEIPESEAEAEVTDAPLTVAEDAAADTKAVAEQDEQVEAANAGAESAEVMQEPDTLAVLSPEADATPPAGLSEPTAPVQDAPALPEVLSLLDNDTPTMPGRPADAIINRPGATAEPVTGPGEEFPDISADPSVPALQRWAAEFGNPAGLPLLSVMLLDNGELSDGPRAIAEIPFPVTVLIDPTRVGAEALMAAYRAEGIEVAAIAALPAGASGTDTAVAMQATFDVLPETVALVQMAEDDAPLGRDAADSVMADLQREGRGFVTSEQGISGALRAAEGAAVPAASIYRDLDGNGQDARVIRRFIDQAAFRARQQEGVVLMGRLRPDTLSALILWGTANRAGQVAMAPLSAVLQAE